MKRHQAKLAALIGLLAVSACATDGVSQARFNYPPLIIGANVYPLTGQGPFPRSCPPAGMRVEQKGGPTMEYLGADPSNPDLCQMRVDGDLVKGWYGIWLTIWPGQENAYPALKQIIHGSTGDVVGFDTRMQPGLQWHDLIRNEGVEYITLLGKTYTAYKISHYREGFEGNNYRSVSTIWKDVPTGLLIYGTYDHIAGQPSIDDPLLPTEIVTGTP
jgi:hypothetical protein